MRFNSKIHYNFLSMKVVRETRTERPEDTRAEGSGWKHVAAAAFICASVFLAYSGSLHGTWALDDSAIGQFRSIRSVLSSRVAQELEGRSIYEQFGAWCVYP